MEFVIISVILFLVAGVLAWRDYKMSSRLDVLDRPAPTYAVDVQRSSPGDVVAISGTARVGDPLLSKYTRTPCVYFSSTKQRKVVSPQVVGQFQSAIGVPGGSRRRNRRHSYWETVETFRQAVPFYIEDGTGRVQVNPEGALFDADDVLSRYDSSDVGDSFGLAGGAVILGSGGQAGELYYEESIIPVDAEVSVLGVVDENGRVGRYDGRVELFISHRSADGLRKHLEQRTKLYFFGAIAFGSAGVILGAFGLSGMIG
jgi:hypothetical protein